MTKHKGAATWKGNQIETNGEQRTKSILIYPRDEADTIEDEGEGSGGGVTLRRKGAQFIATAGDSPAGLWVRCAKP